MPEHVIRRRCKPFLLAITLAGFVSQAAGAEAWRPVLRQIDLPHNYYFREMYLPQLTSGPSSLAWSPDGQELIYSMQGSLWRQRIDATTAQQLTRGPGYDYQPDWAADGERVVFARHHDDSIELVLLDLRDHSEHRIMDTGAVNVEPRWSPDGGRIAWVSTKDTGHFHVHVGEINGRTLTGAILRPERKSNVPRYYYSAFDHELSPSWSPDGTELLIVSNPDTGYGTGGLWRVYADGSGALRPVQIEETTWKARPDWGRDGRRVIYSSYAGRQWHQLWTTTAQGGHPFPLTYGEFDITAARWSPDQSRIAFISNRSGNTAIGIRDGVSGAPQELRVLERVYLQPMGTLRVETRDPSGRAVAARVSVRAADDRYHAPDDAWVHAADGLVENVQESETRYFHGTGNDTLRLPAGRAQVVVWRGPEYGIERASVEIADGATAQVEVAIKPLDMPAEWNNWISADLHVHMNYGGTYRNTPPRLLRQAEAEDLDVVYNLVVNKEQRIPDIDYFTPEPDAASTETRLLLHGQEFHTSLWGHVGLLGLSSHLLLPDYAGYPGTAAASAYPHNAVVSEMARAQGALAGYVHPFDFFPDPDTEMPLANMLPVDVALGKTDYYEVVGFSDHRSSAEVWHRLLNCGFRVAAAAGTDAMANYASLRGPVGLNRVYVRTGPVAAEPAARRRALLEGIAAGHTLATNGPLLLFTLADAKPGETVEAAGRKLVPFHALLQSNVPVGRLEIIMNGKVARSITVRNGGRSAQVSGELDVTGAGWVLLRAFGESATPELLDIYPYATTNPIYITAAAGDRQGECPADYFLRWIDRIEAEAAAQDYNTTAERNAVLDDIRRARTEFEALRR